MSAMTDRYYGDVVHITGAGGLVVERLDGLGRVYVPSSQTALVGAALAPGDRLEFGLIPGGEGRDAVMA
jgi:hypothetical protein